jgi:hypothetical protein
LWTVTQAGANSSGPWDLALGRRRVLQDRGEHERHPALGRAGADQPVAGRRHHRVVHGVDPVQHPERDLQRLRLAGRPAQVRLERVPEPAVGVPVGGQGGQHRGPVAAQELVGEPVAVDEPAGAPHEVGRGIQHVGHGVLLCSSVAPMVVRDRAGRL